MIIMSYRLMLILTVLFSFINNVQASPCSYLFELDDCNGNNFHLYGSNHSLPFNYLPKELQNKLQSFSVFITESDNHTKPITYECLKKLSFISENQNDFKQLNDDEKDELRKYVIPALEKKRMNVTINELSFLGLVSFYDVGQEIFGLDYALLDFYKENSKIILGLETLESQLNYGTKVVTLEQIKNFLQIKGGYESEEARILDSDYLSGKSIMPLQENEHDIIIRNLDMIDPIREFTKIHRNSLICMGYKHIYHLLQWLSKYGYKIKQWNEQGEFKPFEVESSKF